MKGYGMAHTAYPPISSEPGVMMTLMPGQPIPEGWEPVRRVTFKRVSHSGDGQVITPGTYRAILPDACALRLASCYDGVHGAGVRIEFSDGRTRPMYLIDEDDVEDSLFATLKPKERRAIRAHFKASRAPAPAAR